MTNAVTNAVTNSAVKVAAMVLLKKLKDLFFMGGVSPNLENSFSRNILVLC